MLRDSISAEEMTLGKDTYVNSTNTMEKGMSGISPNDLVHLIKLAVPRSKHRMRPQPVAYPR